MSLEKERGRFATGLETALPVLRQGIRDASEDFTQTVRENGLGKLAHTLAITTPGMGAITVGIINMGEKMGNPVPFHPSNKLGFIIGAAIGVAKAVQHFTPNISYSTLLENAAETFKHATAEWNWRHPDRIKQMKLSFPTRTDALVESVGIKIQQGKTKLGEQLALPFPEQTSYQF